MARSFNGTTDKGVQSSAAVTATGFSIAGWAYIPSSYTGGRVMFELSDGTINEAHTLQFPNNLLLRATSTSATISANATSVGAISLATWTHVGGVWTSATSRACFLSGTKATNATSKTPAGINKTTIGCSGAGTNFFPGSLAEFAVWNIALADADMTVLAGGVSPLFVRPDAIVGYYPLIGTYSPEIDLVGRRDFTLTGTTASAHPAIYTPAGSRSRRMITSGAAAASSIVMRRNLSPVGTRAGSRQVHWN